MMTSARPAIADARIHSSEASRTPHRARDLRLRNHLVLAEEPLDLSGQGPRHLELFLQYAAQFVEHDLGHDEFMVGKCDAEYVGTESPGAECAGEDVGVEEHPHDTSRTTSSSTR